MMIPSAPHAQASCRARSRARPAASLRSSKRERSSRRSRRAFRHRSNRLRGSYARCRILRARRRGKTGHSRPIHSLGFRAPAARFQPIPSGITVSLDTPAETSRQGTPAPDALPPSFDPRISSVRLSPCGKRHWRKEVILRGSTPSHRVEIRTRGRKKGRRSI